MAVRVIVREAIQHRTTFKYSYPRQFRRSTESPGASLPRGESKLILLVTYSYVLPWAVVCPGEELRQQGRQSTHVSLSVSQGMEMASFTQIQAAVPDDAFLSNNHSAIVAATHHGAHTE